MKVVIKFVFSLAVLLLLSSTAIAEEYIWDQTTYMAKPGSYLNIEWFSSIGQEFTPNLTNLEVVQLEITNAVSPAEFSVNIYSASFNGCLIGTSFTTTLPGNFDGTATFLFESLSLQPQQLYLLELVTSQETAMVRASYAPNYLQGRGVLFGIPDEEIDLYFREGIIIENVLERLSWASIKHQSWR